MVMKPASKLVLIEQYAFNSVLARNIGTTSSMESRYYLSSLDYSEDPNAASRFLAHIRQHWAIENF